MDVLIGAMPGFSRIARTFRGEQYGADKRNGQVGQRVRPQAARHGFAHSPGTTGTQRIKEKDSLDFEHHNRNIIELRRIPTE